MSLTLQQIFALNPTTVVADTDLFYLVQSPYTPGTDAAILGLDLKAAVSGVTSISAGTGITLTPNPITTTGSVALTVPVAVTSGGTGLTSTTINQLLYSSANNVISGLPSVIRSSLSTNSTGVPTWLPLTNGQLVIGSTAGSPLGASLTAGSGVTITPGSNSITIAATGTGGTVTSISAGTGITLTPNPITTTGTVALTVPVAVTSGGTGLVSTTVNQLLYSSSTNVIDGLASANSSMLRTNSTGVPGFSASMTDGQVMIGVTSGTPAPATITAGTGITITNGAGAITVTATGGAGIAWNTVSGTTQAMVASNGYNCTNAALTTCTLPTTAAQYTYIHVVATTAAGWKIAQNASQSIQFGNVATSVGTGGSLQSTAIGDHVLLLNTTANNTWLVVSAQGNITVV